MERMESLGRSKFVAAFAGLACVALLAGVLGADAQGKKKKGKGGAAVVLADSQSTILDAGAVRLSGARGKVIVRATSGGEALGKVATYGGKKKGKKKGGKGKPKSAAAAKVVSVKLTQEGVELLSGCAADALSATTKGKKSRVRSTPLDRDLGICSVPSENPTAEAVQGPADRHDELRPLRLPRPGRLPAALAERLLHGRRPVHRHGPPPRPRPGLDAPQQERNADRRHRLPARRRLQPGQHDHRQDPAGPDAGRVPELRPGPDQQPASLRRRQPARHRDRRRDGRAPSDLGRGGREPDGSGQLRQPRRTRT